MAVGNIKLVTGPAARAKSKEGALAVPPVSFFEGRLFRHARAGAIRRSRQAGQFDGELESSEDGVGTEECCDWWERAIDNRAMMMGFLAIGGIRWRN